MTTAQQLENTAHNLLMLSDYPDAPDTLEQEALSIFNTLALIDPINQVVVQSYVNAMGERHARAVVLTKGNREIWQESTHYRTEPPCEVSPVLAQNIWETMYKVAQPKGKDITLTI